jgi:periplasmic mercuric ion binding protein
MKNIVTISLSLVFTLFVSLNLFAGTETETIKIKTNAVCGECKARIEGNVVKLKGVKNAVLDLDTKVLTVTYNKEKVSATDIKKAVTDTGYNADAIAGNEQVRSKLPHCCQTDGHKH